MATTTGQSASPLADLTYFNNRSEGGISPDEVNSARGQALLAALRKYDPNAAFVNTGAGGESGADGYTLEFDASKLPGVSGQGTLGATPGMSGAGTGALYMPSFSTVQPAMQLANPNAVTNSPVYGTVTANTNITQPSSLLDTLGPAAVLAFGALFGGLPFLTQGITGSLPGGATDFTYTGASGAVDSWDPSVMGDPTAYGMNAPGAGVGLGGAGNNPFNPANTPLGSAESSLYGPDAQVAPTYALGPPADLPPNTPLGSAESSLYGPDVGNNPGDALGGLANAPTNTLLDSGLSASSILHGLSNFAGALSKIPGGLGGLGGGGGGGNGGGGGGGLLNLPPAQYGSLANLVKQYYGGLLGT